MTSELDVASKGDKKERQDDMEILKRNGSKKHEKEMRQEDEEDVLRKSKEETKRYQRMEWNEERRDVLVGMSFNAFPCDDSSLFVLHSAPLFFPLIFSFLVSYDS